MARGEGAAEIDSFDSEVFAWTQHPCSPELDANLKNVQVSVGNVLLSLHLRSVAEIHELTHAYWAELDAG